MFYPEYRLRSDPLALMRSMLRDFDRMTPTRTTQGGFPAVNLWQGDDTVAVTAELPGVEPSEVDISVKDNILTITGERRAPQLPEAAHWHRNERVYGKFNRFVRLPFTASDEKVEARMTNGVLRVVVGRPEEDKPKKIEIKAE